MKLPVIVMLLSCCLGLAPARAEIAESSVPGADGVRLHVLQAGPTDATASILFIPGHLISATIWSQQLDYFAARGYRVVTVDPRSQGGSSQAQDNAPADRGRDIQALIQDLKLTHLTLVGWSQGVQDVAAYVGQYGTGAVQRIVLVDSSVSSGPDAVRQAPAFVQAELQGIALYSRHPRDYCDGMLHAIISVPIPAQTLQRLDEECARTPPDVSSSMLVQDLFTTDLRPALQRFDKPTLVIASASSFELDAQKQMAAALPQGQFAAIQHAAHAVFFDQPVEFDRLLGDFIQDRPVTAHDR